MPPHRRRTSGPSMRNRFQQKATYSVFRDKKARFLPQGELDELITEEAILITFQDDQGIDPVDDLVTFIQQKARRVFAIIIDIKFENPYYAMSLFKDNNFCDADLPITRIPEDMQCLPNREVRHEFFTFEKNTKDPWWDKSSIGDFYQRQWDFIAPVFSTSVKHHTFSEDAIIPFIEKPATFAEGSFGKVTQFKVHPKHIQQSDTTIFAVKEIKVDRKEDRSSVATHWQSEVQALEKMNELDKNHIVRFITAFRCGKENDYHHYLMFEWADGGNLINLWEKIKSPEKTPEFLQAVLKELLGLASVLAAAHYMEGNSSYRHGDLKPANILWFPGGRGKIGTLKIGDWGEAKIHFVNTEARRHNTSAKYATRRYEAPENGTGITLGPSLEVDPKAKKANDRRSRLYDIWGIGCIFLEMLVWLVYGFAGHEKFAGDIKDDADQVSPFYQVRKDARGKKYAEVHELVDAWMTALAKDPYCQVGTTALGDLLEVIRIGLLVVKLPEKGGTQEFSVSQESPPAMEVIPLANAPNIVISHEDHDTEDILSGMLVPDASKPEVMTHSIKNPGSDVPSRLADKGKGKGRILATELKKRLECITCHKEDSYWQPDRSVESDEQALHAKTYPSLVIRPRENGAPRLKVVGPIPPNYEHPPLDPDDWIYKLDNLFATSLFEHLQSSKEPLMPQSVSIDPLCKRCEEFRDFLWQPSSYFKIEKSDLSARAQSNKCSLCRLLWKVCSSSSSSSQESDRLPESLLFRRIDAGLCINDSRLPALSTFRGPRVETPSTVDMQIGFAELPNAGEPLHLEIIKQWLADCDTKHKTCAPRRDGSTGHSIPTRLIDVGQVGEPTVQLLENAPVDAGGWIALSHQWGTGRHFSTNVKNLAEHKRGLDYENLPGTFKDAVIITRALGRRYLWIDSICIIQGDGGDFQTESEKMEDVYNGAYCVIAASRAAGHFDGFLQRRQKRDRVVTQPKGCSTQVYICETIDNFKEHVLDGALNSRGWVLQEHALARRTIFFTEKQTYFECGDGVRCESMSKMNNKSAELLGDPDFPHILVEARQGERILRYQELYQKYSRLGLSEARDRANAIYGLEKKLLRTMQVEGGFGILEDAKYKGTLGRSLLWHRGSDTSSLVRIRNAHVPSWSWMAYSGTKDSTGKSYPGGIDYFPPDFAGKDWEDIQSPWSTPTKNGPPNTLTANGWAYDIAVDGAMADPAVCIIIYDVPAEVFYDVSIDDRKHKPRCVVLGIQKGEQQRGERTHYVLLIRPTQDPDGEHSVLYERVGAGFMPGKCIQERDLIKVHVR